jgi:hypothetical protein
MAQASVHRSLQKQTERRNAGSSRNTDFALACQYCDEETYTELDRKYEMILSKLNTMDMKAETFCFAADR